MWNLLGTGTTSTHLPTLLYTKFNLDFTILPPSANLMDIHFIPVMTLFNDMIIMGP